MSSNRVSRICESLDEAVSEMQGRSLADSRFPYVWLDATCIKCREDGHVQSTALVTAIGVGSDGYRRLLGMDAIDGIAGFCPRAAGLLEDAEADALAYLDFPYEHHRRLRTDNVQERANREPKRRSRVVQVFPSRKSLMRLMGAVFSEMDEEWAGRRWFNDKSIGRAVEGAGVNAPRPAYEGSAAEHAARIIALVMADNPVAGGRAA